MQDDHPAPVAGSATDGSESLSATESAGPATTPSIPTWLRSLVTFMDDAITIPGTRFQVGFDAIAGMLLPGAGDAITTGSQLALLWTALRARVPRTILARMLINVGTDALVGAVPLLGDLFDATFKANRRNLQLLEQHIGPPATGRRRLRLADHAIVWGVMLTAVALLSLPLIAALLIGSLLLQA